MEQTPPKTLYESSTGSIFWKNFVAGFARALGGLIIWIFLILFSGYVFVSQVWPRIHPLIASYQQLVETFTKVPTSQESIKETLNY